MPEKLTFTLQVFFLGFSVVLVVLFFLYALIELTNRLREGLTAPPPERTPPPSSAEPDRLPPAVAAAITAAVNCYRENASESRGPVRIRIIPPQSGGSSWVVAGRRALLENSTLWERLRRN